jgi:hypothetical protein
MTGLVLPLEMHKEIGYSKVFCVAVIHLLFISRFYPQRPAPGGVSKGITGYGWKA